MNSEKVRTALRSRVVLTSAVTGGSVSALATAVALFSQVVNPNVESLTVFGVVLVILVAGGIGALYGAGALGLLLVIIGRKERSRVSLRFRMFGAGVAITFVVAASMNHVFNSPENAVPVVVISVSAALLAAAIGVGLPASDSNAPTALSGTCERVRRDVKQMPDRRSLTGRLTGRGGLRRCVCRAEQLWWW